jgi:hypothetical protein
MKEQLVADKGIQDLPPFMLVLTDAGESFFGNPGPGLEDALAIGTRMGDVLAASVMSLRGDHDMVKLRRMMMVTEGFARVGTDEGALRAVEHGDLARDYATNPNSDVTEMLMTNMWEYINDQIVFHVWTTQFHYTDGGVIVWGEEWGPADTDGDLPEAGKRVMRSE